MATQASLASRNALISRRGAGSALARVARPVGVRRVVNSRQAVHMAASVSWGAMSAEAMSALPDGESALKTLVASGGCEVEAGSGVYQLGNRAHYNGGAASYLIKRDGGNVLVGCPKYSEALANSLKEMGGVRWIVVLDASVASKTFQWTEAFPEAERVMHVVEASTSATGSKDKINQFEVLLGKGHMWGAAVSGVQKNRLWGKQKARKYKVVSGQAGMAPYDWAQGPGPVYNLDASDELKLILTPGSSEGSMCLLYKDMALFSGETLGMQKPKGSFEGATEWDLLGFNPKKSSNQAAQVLSVAALEGYTFSWLLPGSAGAAKFDSEDQRKEALGNAVSKLSVEVPDEYDINDIYSRNNEYLCA